MELKKVRSFLIHAISCRTASFVSITHCWCSKTTSQGWDDHENEQPKTTWEELVNDLLTPGNFQLYFLSTPVNGITGTDKGDEAEVVHS